MLDTFFLQQVPSLVYDVCCLKIDRSLLQQSLRSATTMLEANKIWWRRKIAFRLLTR
jgi:hypothetical protein